MSLNPLVSVVVPAFHSTHIGECLASIVSQTVPPYEIIVVDSSPEETTPCLKEFGRHVVYIEQPPRGVSAARNAGIKVARGDYIAFLDADDLWLPEKLERQLRGFSRFPQAVFSFCTVWNLAEDPDPAIPREPFFPPNLTAWLARVGEEQGTAAGSVYELILSGNCIATSSLVVRRDALETIDLFDETMRNGEDYEFELRLAQAYSAVFVRSPMVRYRIHNSGLSGAWSQRSQLFYRANIDALSKHYEKIPLERVKTALARTYADFALFHLKSGQYTEAGRLARTSLALQVSRRALRYYLESAFPMLYAGLSKASRMVRLPTK